MNNTHKIGVIVAIEINAVLSKYGKPKGIIKESGYTIHTYQNNNCIMYVLESGAGEISAATGTQFLISKFDVDMIINFGVVGALTEEIKTAELCIVESVIHYDFDTTNWLNLPRGQYPDQKSPYLYATPELIKKAIKINPVLKKVICASADKFISDSQNKTLLHEKYNADICEMEAAGIVLTCKRNNIPCLLIKAVSDSLTGGGTEFAVELERVSLICFEVVDQIIRNL